MAVQVSRRDADGDGAGRRARGELESEVLAALWAAGRPCTANQVQQALHGDGGDGDDSDVGGAAGPGGQVAYNTVQTILTRLHDKGMVLRERHGRAHVYWPARGQAELAAEQMHQVLARGPDHTAVLQRFVSALSVDEEHALRELLAGSRSDADSGGDPQADRGSGRRRRRSG